MKLSSFFRRSVKALAIVSAVALPMIAQAQPVAPATAGSCTCHCSYTTTRRVVRAISVYPSEGTTRAEAEAQCTATCAAEATGHSGTSPVTTLDRCSEGLFSAVEATPTPPASSAPADSGGSVTLFNPLGANVGVAEFISRGIRAVIGIIGAMALLMFIYGGVMWMTAGDSKRVESSKEILKNSTIGLLLIFFSYSIVSVIFSLLGTS